MDGQSERPKVKMCMRCYSTTFPESREELWLKLLKQRTVGGGTGPRNARQCSGHGREQLDPAEEREGKYLRGSRNKQ